MPERDRPASRCRARAPQVEPPRAVRLDDRLLIRSDEPASYLEIGDRTPGDRVTYPDDELVAERVDGDWKFFRRDGRPYE